MGFLFWGKKKDNKKEVKKEKEKVVEKKASKSTPEKGVKTTAKKDTTKKTTPVSKKTTTSTKKETATKKVEVKEEEKQEPSTKIYHVSLRKDGKWQVKYGGGEKAIKLFETQAEAIDFAKEKAENQEGAISIHKKDGKIRKQDYSKKVEEDKK